MTPSDMEDMPVKRLEVKKVHDTPRWDLVILLGQKIQKGDLAHVSSLLYPISHETRKYSLYLCAIQKRVIMYIK